MEFMCLWSKDAQQKKRKRWTDGVARFSPASGLLSIWDQDNAVKITSTRLKPDEAVAALRDDVEETRVGSISLQIIGPVESSAQRQETPPLETQGVATPHLQSIATSGSVDPAGGHDDPSKAVTRTVGLQFSSKSSSSSVLTPTVVSRGSSNQAPDQASGLEEATSGIHPQPPTSAPASSDHPGAAVSTGFSGRPSSTHQKGPSLKNRAFKPLKSSLGPRARDGKRPDASELSSTKGNKGIHELNKDYSFRPNEVGGGVRGAARVGLLGGRVGGAGGARRFHAPRSTVVTAGTQSARIGSGGRPTTVVDVATAAGTSNAVENHNDLVLEWTTGVPPQPITAGGSLTRKLHPHQRDGLKVLWRCLAGRGGYDGRGAILADEMGLGKTATAIALCTCVLRHRRVECRKAVVVCPSSLVKNWANEFRKWCPLGGGAVAMDQAGAAAAEMVADFKIGAPARYPILVISYELYRNHDSVINATEGLGLLIADEGHRLKNSAETKTARALKACPAAMRLVMTGTPMQNDLDEFFAMSDFVNPGLLGSLKSFRSRYTRPIKAAWDREATEEVKELAAERTRELGKLTGKFVLRRTKDVIRGSLPPALEIVVFCRPSQRQLSLYERYIAGSSATASLFADDGAADASAIPQQFSFRDVLPLISTLRRLCNHPDLVKTSSGSGGTKSLDDDDYPHEKLPDHVGDDSDDDLAFLLMDDEEEEKGRRRAESRGKENNLENERGGGLDHGLARSCQVPRLTETEMEVGKEVDVGAGMGAENVPELSSSFAQGEKAVATVKYEAEDSGKLLVLEGLLRSIRQEFPGDKVVITSNFTSALDVLVALAGRNGWGFQRLDGGTASNARQPLVDQFNKASAGDLFLFFLSARAGGVGLNLIGANRIVLYDSDWNPATDDQAMARVWRLGQTKEVSMYRLVSTGTLEETIFQRQIFKGALYGLIHDSNQSSSSRITPASLDSGGRGQVGGSERANDRGGTRSREGRGFSQEELKELFVLKTGTASDTYDKLRRRHPLAQRGNGVSERLSPSEDNHDGTESSAEGWKEYKTPSDVEDLALRRALENQTAKVGGVVTFVREVKRGGKLRAAEYASNNWAREDEGVM